MVSLLKDECLVVARPPPLPLSGGHTCQSHTEYICMCSVCSSCSREGASPPPCGLHYRCMRNLMESEGCSWVPRTTQHFHMQTRLHELACCCCCCFLTCIHTLGAYRWVHSWVPTSIAYNWPSALCCWLPLWCGALQWVLNTQVGVKTCLIDCHFNFIPKASPPSPWKGAEQAAAWRGTKTSTSIKAQATKC